MSDDAVSKAGGVERWSIPAIETTPDNVLPTAGRLEELQKHAYDEAFRRGYDEGLEAGKEEILARARRLDQLLNALAAPLDELDGSIEKQLVELAMTTLRQLFHREIELDPSCVEDIFREAMQLLPASKRDVRIHLHPEDAELIRSSLNGTESEFKWTLVEDAELSQGGCEVISENSRIDARVETRLSALIAKITGFDCR